MRAMYQWLPTNHRPGIPPLPTPCTAHPTLASSRELIHHQVDSEDGDLATESRI